MWFVTKREQGASRNASWGFAGWGGPSAGATTRHVQACSRFPRSSCFPPPRITITVELCAYHVLDAASWLDAPKFPKSRQQYLRYPLSDLPSLSAARAPCQLRSLSQKRDTPLFRRLLDMGGIYVGLT